jgi:hypothetical protein
LIDLVAATSQKGQELSKSLKMKSWSKAPGGQKNLPGAYAN